MIDLTGCAHLFGGEEAMLRLTCDRARLEDGMEVLDLGSGWGSLSLWIAERANVEIEFGKPLLPDFPLPEGPTTDTSSPSMIWRSTPRNARTGGVPGYSLVTPASDSDDAVVTFTDVPPTVTITKTPDPASVPETGGDVTYTVLIDITAGDTSQLGWGMTTFVDIEVEPNL